MKTAREVAFNVRGRSRPWRASPYCREWSRMTRGLATKTTGTPETAANGWSIRMLQGRLLARQLASGSRWPRFPGDDHF
jgi:hypothetical protein